MMAKKSVNKISVLVGSVGSETHYFVYSEIPKTKDRKEMIFDGSDNVHIDEKHPTQGKGCWADVSARPEAIKALVGARGLAFLTLLEKKRTRRYYHKTPKRRRELRQYSFFNELRVVSAWQFYTVRGWGQADRIVLWALKKHLGKPIKKENWVL